MLAAIHNGAREGLGIPGTTANLDVRALAEDQRGDLWVGTENEGLYRRQGPIGATSASRRGWNVTRSGRSMRMAGRCG